MIYFEFVNASIRIILENGVSKEIFPVFRLHFRLSLNVLSFYPPFLFV